MEISNKGGNKVKGITIQFDLLYIIIFFLLVTAVIIGVIVLTSNRIKEGIESGKIWEWIENMLRKGIKG